MLSGNIICHLHILIFRNIFTKFRIHDHILEIDLGRCKKKTFLGILEFEIFVNVTVLMMKLISFPIVKETVC